MRGIGWRVDARLDRVHLDGEFVAEQRCEVIGTDVVRGVESALSCARDVRRRGRGKRRAATRPVAPSRARSAPPPRRSPSAAPGTASTRGRTSAPATRSAARPHTPTRPWYRRVRLHPRPHYGDVGYVDRGDCPATSGEPDRVGAFTTSDVECPARLDVGDLGDESPVGASTPHRAVALAVSRVPLAGLCRSVEPMLALFVLVHGLHATRLSDSPRRTSPSARRHFRRAPGRGVDRPVSVIRKRAISTRPNTAEETLMPELLVDFITSLDGYGAADGWPGWKHRS